MNVEIVFISITIDKKTARDRITKNEYKKLNLSNFLLRTNVLYSAGLPYQINIRYYGIQILIQISYNSLID